MLAANVWRKLLGVAQATVIESIDFDEEAESVVVRVRARRSSKRRCGVCGRRAGGYDQGEGRRNWRALDLGGLVCYLQSDAPRVNCAEHGPKVAQVPWARHGAGHTPDFDDQVAWLVTHTAKSAIFEQFFDPLGEQRCRLVKPLSADAAECNATGVAERCPDAALCADAFHMVAWATRALDDVRREIWRAAKKAGAPALTAGINGCRHALLNNPDHLTNNQQAGLARLAQVNAPVESTNTKPRLLTRTAYGYRSTNNLTSPGLLDRGGYRPPLPGRVQAAHHPRSREQETRPGDGAGHPAPRQRVGYEAGAEDRSKGVRRPPSDVRLCRWFGLAGPLPLPSHQAACASPRNQTSAVARRRRRRRSGCRKQILDDGVVRSPSRLALG